MFGGKKFLVRVETNVSWRVAFDAQARVYVGVCDMLNLNAIGDTWSEFQECANEAMALLFQDLFECNELDAFLLRNGWKLMATPPPGHEPVFDVPWDHTNIEPSQLTPVDA